MAPTKLLGRDPSPHLFVRSDDFVRADDLGNETWRAGWPTFPFNELRLPHPSRFSKDGLQKLGNELFPASYPQLRGALLIH